MEWQRAEGIVLRRQPVTETSLIITWFTRGHGKLKTIAKGARRLKTPFLGKLDLFYHDEFLFVPSRRSDLHLLHECFLLEPHSALSRSYSLLSQASCGCELVDLVSEPEDPQPHLYNALRQWLNELPQVCERDSRPLFYWFALQVLSAAGWQPRWARMEGGHRLLATLMDAQPMVAGRVKLTNEQANSANRIFWQYWREKVGRMPRSWQALPF